MNIQVVVVIKQKQQKYVKFNFCCFGFAESLKKKKKNLVGFQEKNNPILKVFPKNKQTNKK